MKNTDISGTILIVDGTPENLSLLLQMFTDHGYIVRAAKSGMEALELINTTLPDLVLLDARLPDLSGYDICAHLKSNEKTSEIPILFLSVLNETEDKIRGFAVGGVDYITKPFKHEEVIVRVKTHLEISQLRKQLELKNEELKLKNEQLLTESTERKQAENAMIEGEQLLRESQRVAGLGSYVWDLSKGLWKSSKILDDIFGIDENYIRSFEGWINLIHPDWQDIMSDYVTNEVLGKHQRFDKEYKIIRNDNGQEYWVHGLGQLEYDNKNQPVKLIGTISDITKRKLAIETLQKSEQEFRNLAESMPQIVWITRPDGWNVYFNQQWIDYTGMTLEDSYGHGWNKPFHPDDQQRALEAWQNAVNNNGIYSIEASLRRFDGEYHWWLVRGVPQINEHGEILKWFGTCTDIEDIKQAQEGLISSETLYRSLFENMLNGFAYCQMLYENGRPSDFIYLNVNKSFELLTGLKNVTGKKVSEVIPGIRESDSPLLEIYGRVALTGKPETFEMFVKGLNNWYFISVYSPKKEFFVSVFDVITERKLAEEKIQSSEIRYRRLFESAKDGILILDAETGKIVDVNPFLINLLSFSKEQFLEKEIWDIGFFKDIFPNQDKFLELQQKEYVRYENLPLETADGQRKDVEFVSNVYLANNHKVVQCNIRDITERILQEKKVKLFAKILEHLNRHNERQSLMSDILKEIKSFSGFDAVGIRLKSGEDYPYFVQNGFSEDFLRTEQYLCDYDKSGNIISDSSGKPSLACMCGNIISCRTDQSKSFFTEKGSFWTNSTTKLLASTTEKGIYVHTHNRCNREGYESEALIPLRAGDMVIGLLQLTDKHPDRFTLELINFYEKIASTIGVAFTRMQFNEKIIKLNEELEQRVIERTAELETANKELESFSYSISHDLRAPLRAINGFSNILLQDYSEKLDEEGQRLFNVVISNAKKMGNLIDDILAFSKINRNQLSKSEIDMKTLVNSVFQEVISEQEREKISFSIADLPKAKGDSSMMKQVWINLISNAVKFTSKKENPKIEIGCKHEDGNNVYFIKDNGVGFDMNSYEKLFGVFHRLHSESEYKGTGVGLSIVKSIVTKHGGKIWGESELNVGTTFYFWLE